MSKLLAALFRLGRRIGVWPYIWVVHNGRAEDGEVFHFQSLDLARDLRFAPVYDFEIATHSVQGPDFQRNGSRTPFVKPAKDGDFLDAEDAESSIGYQSIRVLGCRKPGNLDIR